MKIIMDVKTLKNCLDMANSVVNQNNINSILQHVKITASGKSVSFYAIGNESQIEISTNDCEILEEGTIAIPHSRILRLLSEYKTGDAAEIEIVKNSIAVKVKNNRFNFLTIDPDNFPLLESFDDSTASEITAAEFCAGINHVSHNTDGKASQKVFGGICIRFGEKLTFIATDTRQMAIYNADYNNSAGNHGDCIVVSDTAINAARVIGLSDSQNLKVFPQKNRLVLKTEKVTFCCSLIDGVYPQVTKISQYPPVAKTTIDKKEFGSLLRQADLVTSKESSGVIFDYSADLLQFHSQSSDYGESNLSMEIKGDLDSKIATKFNAQFILADIAKLQGDTITLQFNSKENSKPIYVKSNDDPNALYLVMPMSLSPVEKQIYGVNNGN